MEEQVLVEDEDSNLRAIRMAIETAEQGAQEHRDQAYRWRRVLRLRFPGATPDELKAEAELTIAATRLIQKSWPATTVSDMLATCDIEDLCGEEGLLAVRGFVVAHVFAADTYRSDAKWARQAENATRKGD